jgi:hypothetical protein
MSAVKEEEGGEVSDPEKSTGHRPSFPTYLLIEDKPSLQTIEEHLNPTFILSQSLSVMLVGGGAC